MDALPARHAFRLRPAEIPVFILCGGLGTRLRSVESSPKAVIRVAGRPFLSYTLRLLQKQGFRKIHLLLGVGADQVQAAFSGPGIEYSREAEPSGTGCALGLARDRAGGANLILNGDSYAEATYPDLLAEHAARGASADLGLTLLALEKDDSCDYGGLHLEPDGRVSAFLEKGLRGPGWINAGVYAAGGGFLRGLPQGRFSLEQEILPALAGRGLLWAQRRRFFFRDIGTAERLRLAQQEFRWIQNRIEDEGDTALRELDQILGEE